MRSTNITSTRSIAAFLLLAAGLALADAPVWDIARMKAHCAGCKADLDWASTECPKCHAKVEWASPKFPPTPEGSVRLFLFGIAMHDAGLVGSSLRDSEDAELLTRGEAPSADEITKKVLPALAAAGARCDLSTKTCMSTNVKVFGKPFRLFLYTTGSDWRVEAGPVATYRHDVWKEECQKRLLAFGKAYAAYKTKNKKAPTERGKDLVLLLAKEAGVEAGCSSACPADGKSTNYEAFEGGDIDSLPATRWIVWDAASNHAKMRFCLRADGKVECVTEEDFNKRK